MINKEDAIKTGQKMYLDNHIAKRFLDSERNYELNLNHISVSRSFEAIILSEIREKQKLSIANLGAGGCPDEFEMLLEYLKANNSKILWIDYSNTMIEEAQNYLPNEYKNNVFFLKEDFIDNLDFLENNSLDVVLMQYTFNYIVDLKNFFLNISKKMKKNTIFMANPNIYNNGLKYESTNAFYAVNNKNILENEIYHPNDGDLISVRFKTNPKSQDILCEQNIIYHSKESIVNNLPDDMIIEWYDNWIQNKDFLDNFQNNDKNAKLLNNNSLKTVFVIRKK